MIYIFLAILGIAVGALSGLFGIGGGILVLPSLVFICGFTQKTATGTTLAMLLPPIGILAFWEYYKNGLVNIPAAVILVIGFLAGSSAGAKHAILMNEVLLKRGFGILLITIGVIYIYQAGK
ncbi:MAG TPA: TSUP family transporter [Candidatus Wallbacteria bacterium]|nr:MAG: Sulfite exporter TauE/SafE [bacterium ADurb.Bin243]HOD41839.1 TSUP family transporter [Candidatus Wallbacteria bacterium]HPG57165.1 TSUP family transporter [Candidatus Wallbacteria bacterium]